MSNTIASERKRIGLSQTELADSLSKSRFTISRWEKDSSTICGKDLCALSSLFGCSIDYLLGASEERTPNVGFRGFQVPRNPTTPID